jgi:hypothetical protein
MEVEEKDTAISYHLSAYYRQGDDFAVYLGESKPISESLNEWANDLSGLVDKLRKLSLLLKGTTVDADANTNEIILSGDSVSDWEILGTAAIAGLVETEEYEDED